MQLDTSFFGHLMVLISIVLGLGITELFASIGSIIRNRKSIVHDRKQFARCFPLLMWVALVSLVLVQFWWAAWGFSQVKLSIWDYLAVILTTVFHYLLATVVLPNFASSDVVAELSKGAYSLESFYLRNVAWMSGISVTLLVAIMATDLFVFGLDGESTFLAKLPYRIVFIAMLVIVWITGHRNRMREDAARKEIQKYELDTRVWRLHSVVTVAFAVVFFWFIAKLSSDVPGKLQESQGATSSVAAVERRLLGVIVTTP